MITWMLFTVFISLLVVVGARAAESLGRGLDYPVRWIWAGALALVVLLAAVAPLRTLSTRDVATALPEGFRKTLVDAPAASAAWPDVLRARVTRIRAEAGALVTRAVMRVDRAAPRRAGAYLLLAWIVATAMLGALALVVQRRFGRARRDWPLAVLHSIPVRVSPTVGPIVMGVANPEIVVPRWLLGRDAEEQRLVLAHEAEHVWARDTLLLAAACGVAALMPWNPAVWIMVSRLRLATELDCDARVLRSGASPRSYGTLLIDVAAHNAGARFAAPALVGGASHLRQRIMAMNFERSRFAVARAGFAAAIGLVAILAACDANLPTAADVREMDVAAAERAAVELRLANQTGTRYRVDGVLVSEVDAKGLAPEDIERIDVQKSDGNGLVNIYTKGSALRRVRDVQATRTAAGAASRRGDSKLTEVPVSGRPLRVKDLNARASQENAPLFYVDGVLAAPSTLRSMDPREIEKIEVLKGAAATWYSSNPAAANGIIWITTKR